MEITGPILEAANCEGVTKTKIMNKATLSIPIERACDVFD